jgi:hypothetical protein
MDACNVKIADAIEVRQANIKNRQIARAIVQSMVEK